MNRERRIARLEKQLQLTPRPYPHVIVTNVPLMMMSAHLSWCQEFISRLLLGRSQRKS